MLHNKNILDTLPLTVLDTGAGTYSGTYTVPSGGANKLLVVALAGSEAVPTVTLNGETVTVTSFPGTPNRAYYHVGVRAAPTTATLSVSGGNYAFTAFTLKDAAQSLPVDATNNVPSAGSVTTLQGTTTTTIGYDFLASMLVRNNGYLLWEWIPFIIMNNYGHSFRKQDFDEYGKF